MSRVAAIYDIHGNLDALEAVLADVGKAAPDEILVGGDVVMGPFPAEVLERLLALKGKTTFIRGNTDRLSNANDAWGDVRQWVTRKLGPERAAVVEGWPVTAGRDVDGLGAVLFCHGSPRSDEEILTRDTPDDRLRDAIAGVQEGTIVHGHTHMQYDRRALGKRLVCAGSVGLPYEREPGAYWALLGPEVELRRSAYDVARAAGKVRGTDFPNVEDWVLRYMIAPPAPDEVRALFEKMAADRRA